MLPQEFRGYYINKLLLVALLILGLITLSLAFNHLPRNDSAFEAEETTAEVYADISDSSVKTFEDCRQVDGVMLDKNSPTKCYYDDVVYYEAPREGLEDLNPPENLKTYRDCLRNSIELDTENQTCTAWNGKTYPYEGPPVNSYEDCAREMWFILQSNPPQCSGPDGTHFFGPTS